MTKRVAAIDIGTNTVRLLVAEVDDERLVEVERDSRITRLGQDVDAHNELGAQPMERTLEAVCDFSERARAAGAEKIRAAGTSAIRDARNAKAFANAIAKACAISLEVLDGSAEGRLAYAGATSWLGDGDYVVCDIGGGSTELITAAESVSIDVGSVRVRERLLRSDPPSRDEIEAARSAVRSLLDGAPTADGADAVGVAGTITTIAALDAGLEAYDREVVHGYRLTAEAVRRWAQRLNLLPVAEVRRLGPVAPGRTDVIGAGALVLDGVVEHLGCDELIVSERDILDGLVAELVL